MVAYSVERMDNDLVVTLAALIAGRTVESLAGGMVGMSVGHWAAATVG